MKKTIKPSNAGDGFGMETMRVYIIILLFLFYTLPVFLLLIRGDTALMLTEMQLMGLNPIAVFMVTVMYTVRVGINWRFPFIVGLLFAPTTVMFYTLEHIVYAVTYAVIAYAALALGAFIRRLLKL